MGNDFCCESFSKTDDKNKPIIGPKDSITFEEPEIDKLIRATVV